MALDIVNGCKFFPVAGGLGNWVFSTAAPGAIGPDLAGCVTGATYRMHAESPDKTKFECASGILTIAAGVYTFARTTIIYSSNQVSGSFFKQDFGTTIPEIGLVFLAVDIKGVVPAGGATDTILTKQSSTDFDSKWSTATQLRTILGLREVLTADRAYFVRDDGSNSNGGTTNSSGGAWLTLQKAMDVIKQTLDLAGFTVTITCTGAFTAGLQIFNWQGGGIIVFQGSSSVTPSATTVTVLAGNAIDASFGILPGIVRIKDMKLKAAAFAIVSRSAGRLQYTNIVFDTCAAHIVSAGSGLIEPYGASSIVGVALHFVTDVQGTINGTGGDLPSPFTGCTLTGTLAFSTFALSQGGGNITLPSGATYTGGTITGKRYNAVDNSLIKVGASATYFPGNAVGTVATGGTYN